MLQYKPVSIRQRFIALLLIAALLNLMHSCFYYKVTKPDMRSENALASIKLQDKFFILHDKDDAWAISNIKVDTTAFRADVKTLEGHEYYMTTDTSRVNRYKKNPGINESEVLEEVHIYLKDYKVSSGNDVVIPLRLIERIEIYDFAAGTTVATWVFTTLGISASIAGIVMIIFLLTKSSCPFVYSFNGQNYSFEGEIFSGATQPSLERDDYLRLEKTGVPDSSLRVKISNKVKEIQHIDFAELIIAQHATDEEAIMDKNGRIFLYRNPVTPFAAINKNGKNILPLISSKDTLIYAGDPAQIAKNGLEQIFLKFPKPAGTESARLILRAKNNFWLDILFTWFHSLFGDRYDDFSARQEKSSGEQLNKWLIDQHIPLSVYLKKDGKWELTDHFNLPGPMGFRNDILSLNIQGTEQDTVDVMLDFGFMFWDIDYVAMDFGPDAVIDTVVVPLYTATGNDGANLMPLLAKPDGRYYDQNLVGDEATLTFETVRPSKNLQTIFLHTRGYYKILRNQSGKPRMKELKTFRKPGRFAEYSVEQYKKEAEN